ncbi:hypothetical protein ABZS53_15335 [Streptomyces sp. NPDC005499]|uniref:hypothetical protein n=1 Tax=Streptomyces sp. NPDC005499 TaxID=3154883 RepID=UPI0033A3E573
MSRSATRARRKARTATARRNNIGFLDHMRAAEFSATGTHSSLGLLAASRMAERSATVSAAFAAKPSPAVLPHTVPDAAPKPSNMPQRRTIWQAATGTPTPDKAPEPVKVHPAPHLHTRVHTPIKAAELDKEMRAAAMRIVHADGIHGWRLVGVINRDSGRVTVYARKHGASVRYSTAD